MNTNNTLSKQQKHLLAIKNIFDCYNAGTISITSGQDDFDILAQKYDISVIMGMIGNNAYEGLGLNLPKTKINVKGGDIYVID